MCYLLPNETFFFLKKKEKKKKANLYKEVEDGKWDKCDYKQRCAVHDDEYRCEHSSRKLQQDLQRK